MIAHIVPARSIYIMSGPSRYEYTHEIPKLPAGSNRISITVRDSVPRVVGATVGSGSAIAASATAAGENLNVWGGETEPNYGTRGNFEGF